MSDTDIRRAFNGKLHVNNSLAAFVVRTVAKLPDDHIRHITSDCWFLGNVDDAWAYTFRGDELEGKHLIVLSDTLLDQPEQDIIWTIMHEIAHVILNHRNSILVSQTREEISRQERDADEFARTALQKSMM